MITAPSYALVPHDSILFLALLAASEDGISAFYDGIYCGELEAVTAKLLEVECPELLQLTLSPVGCAVR